MQLYYLVDVFYEPQTYDHFKKKGEIQRPFIYCVTVRVKHISLIHIVNKSSTFNISGICHCTVLLYSFIIIIIIIIVINNNEPKAFV